MAQLEQALVAEVANGKAGKGRLVLWQLATLIGLLFYLYHSILWELIKDWWNDPNFSHGFFVPMFSALVVWQERSRLRAMEGRPANLGLVVVAGALALLIVGTLGAELFLSRTSLIWLLGGMILYLLGWRHFRLLLFPWLCLFLMVPIPTIIFNQITLPLQEMAAKFAALLLPVFAVPVLREGNVIILPAMSLEVAEACSGIRSLVSLGTLAVIYGYFMETKRWKKVLLVVLAVPIAIAANALRIVGTGVLVQYWDPNKALGFFHEFSGWLIFLLAMAMLFGLHGALRLLSRRWEKT